MTMTCQTCGGTCFWTGGIFGGGLYETECRQCGAINNQAPEEPPELPDSEGGEAD